MDDFPRFQTKNQVVFHANGHNIKFSGNFDNGNLLNVIKMNDIYIVSSALDSYKTVVTSKTFFHFSVSNYPLNTEIKIRILNVKLLTHLQKINKLSTYRPYLKMGSKAQYNKIEPQNVYVQEDGQNINIFVKIIPTEFIFYLSFALPYSYGKYLNFIRDLPKQQDFYLRKQVLAYSLELRLIYLITISSFDKIQDCEDAIGGQSNGIIFPQKDLNEKQKAFNKPTIIIAARVHPGESPASYGVQGMIKFLISKDLRAYILRKHFQILIIPMLNPDGVYQGFYRMDTAGNNLNRFYATCDEKQPSIYTLRHLINYYEKQKKLLFFFDLHGHPSYRGSFLYGNAFEEIVNQTQSELFSKLLAMNCQTFDLGACNFSKSQMKAKDRPEEFSKQGCARVYTYRVSNIIHSYTFEFGFHSCTQLNNLPRIINEDFIYPGLDDYLLIHKQKKIFSIENWDYKIENYYDEGVSILITILDSLQLNPYTRILNSQEGSLYQMRKIISKDLFLNTERFRILEKNANLKINNINELIEQSFVKKIRQKNYLYESNRLWPQCVKFRKYPPIIQYHKKTSILNKILHSTSQKRSTDFSEKYVDMDIKEFISEEEHNNNNVINDSENKYTINHSVSHHINITTKPVSWLGNQPIIKNFGSNKSDNHNKFINLIPNDNIEKFRCFESQELTSEGKYIFKESQSPKLIKISDEPSSATPIKMRMKIRNKFKDKKLLIEKKQNKKQAQNSEPSSDISNFDDSKMQTHQKYGFKSKFDEFMYHRTNIRKNEDKQSSVLINQNKFQETEYFQYQKLFQKSKKPLDSRSKLIEAECEILHNFKNIKLKLPELEMLKTAQRFADRVGYHLQQGIPIITSQIKERRKSNKQ